MPTRRCSEPAGDPARRRLRGHAAPQPAKPRSIAWHRERPEAVILELLLPDLDGIELCCRLRDRDDMRDPRVVIASTIEQAKIDAFESGADDYVTKPFSPGELRGATRGSVDERLPAGCDSRTDGLRHRPPGTHRSTLRRRGRSISPRPSSRSCGCWRRVAERSATERWQRRSGALAARAHRATHPDPHRESARASSIRNGVASVIGTEIGVGYRFTGRVHTARERPSPASRSAS